MRHDEPESLEPRPEEGNTSQKGDRKNPLWIFILIGVLPLGLGIKAAHWVIGDSWQGLASLNWAKTEGVVIRTGLARSYARGGDQYSLQVLYRYTIDGGEYQNDRISFPETRGGGDEDYYRQQLNTKYPVNKPCVVYYNPSNPAESCLEPGANYLFLVMGSAMSLLLLGGGLYCLVRGIRGFMRGPDAKR
jgi:Protein of unknown function (DUF3592)